MVIFSQNVTWADLSSGQSTSDCKGRRPFFTNVWKFHLQLTSLHRHWTSRLVCWQIAKLNSFFQKSSLFLFFFYDNALKDICHLVVVPAVLQSFYCNYTPYKMDTSLRWTTDTFETDNGHFWSALCNEKYLKTEMKLVLIIRNCS